MRRAAPLAAPVVPALVPPDGHAGSGTGEVDGAADSIRVGLSLPPSVKRGVIRRTEDLNRETLRQPQRPSPQQEIARVAVDRAGIGDLNGSVSASKHHKDRGRVCRAGEHDPLDTAAGEREVRYDVLGRSRFDQGQEERCPEHRCSQHSTKRQAQPKLTFCYCRTLRFRRYQALGSIH